MSMAQPTDLFFLWILGRSHLAVAREPDLLAVRRKVDLHPTRAQCKLETLASDELTRWLG